MIARQFVYALIAGFVCISAIQAETTKEEKVNDFVLHVPDAWKKEQPSNAMRALQFSVPAVAGDPRSGEFAVFNFKGGGTVGQNIERWISQFDREGRKVSLFEGKSAGGRYWIADISGTYNKSVGPPFLRKTESQPGSRVLAVLLVGKQGNVLYLKLDGPEKTIAAQTARIRQMIGADPESEKPFSLEQ